MKYSCKSETTRSHGASIQELFFLSQTTLVRSHQVLGPFFYVRAIYSVLIKL